jgi:MoxR-like ATPase
VLDVRERLALIDPSRLSSSDRVLLEAAKALVDNVVSRPVTSSIVPAAHETAAQDMAVADAAPTANTETVSAAKAAESPSKNFVTETRRRLEAVDKLLEESKR